MCKHFRAMSSMSLPVQRTCPGTPPPPPAPPQKKNPPPRPNPPPPKKKTKKPPTYRELLDPRHQIILFPARERTCVRRTETLCPNVNITSNRRPGTIFSSSISAATPTNASRFLSNINESHHGSVHVCGGSPHQIREHLRADFGLHDDMFTPLGSPSLNSLRHNRNFKARQRTPPPSFFCTVLASFFTRSTDVAIGLELKSRTRLASIAHVRHNATRNTITPCSPSMRGYFPVKINNLILRLPILTLQEH